ncbi:MAG TPA: hypothetical protein VFN51_02145 [Candidatus Saccharimonadales bacterium]|nr:hypothetical protein [Candidatus Saccharimonadales bacterium]
MAIDKQSLAKLKSIMMKKGILSAAIIGLVAAPSIVMAETGGSNVALKTASSTSGVNTTSDSSTPISSGSAAINTAGSFNQGSSSSTTTSDVTGTVTTTGGSTVPTDDYTTLNPGITFEQAVTDAQDVFPSKTITRASLYSFGDSTAFRVLFSDGSQVDINGSNGTVLSSFDSNASTSTTTTATTPQSSPEASINSKIAEGDALFKQAINKLSHHDKGKHADQGDNVSDDANGDR